MLLVLLLAQYYFYFQFLFNLKKSLLLLPDRQHQLTEKNFILTAVTNFTTQQATHLPQFCCTTFITIGILAVKTFLHFTITHKLFAKITHLVSGT